MTLATDAQLVALDFETTGVVDDLPSVPWQIGMVFVAGGKVADAYRYSRLLNPGQRPFNPYAPGRHAVLRDELAAAPELPELWPDLSTWLGGRAIIAHNVATERTVLADAFPLHGFGPWIDTLTLARLAYPGLDSYKLEELVPALGLDARLAGLCPDLAPHDALYDAMAAALVFEHLLEQPGWENATIGDLAQAASRS
jgi:DNA polymerase-3 subunit epsilon